MAKKTTLQDTGERMIPEFSKGGLIYAEHLVRYEAARPLIKNKVVLDIASGSGYGTKLLASTAKKVYGVDVDQGAVTYAQHQYPGANIEYLMGDGVSIPLEDNSIDVVITFETIEHIEDYGQFVKEIKRVLKPDGLAVVSTPNDLEFAEGNHFHVHEFKYKELVSLLSKDFKNIDSYYQATWKYVAIGEESLFADPEGRVDLPTMNLAPLNPKEYLYFYLVCSNRKITEKVTPLAATGEHYSERSMVNDFKTTKAELDRRDANIAELEQLVIDKENARSDTEKLLHKTRQELELVKASRAYQAAQKARQLLPSRKKKG